MSSTEGDLQVQKLARSGSTLVAALLLLISVGLPLTRQGVGSATSSIDLLRLGASLEDPVIAWASRLVAVAMTGGVPLGLALLLPQRPGVMLWWCSVGLILTVGVVLAGLLRENVGTGGLMILAAGLVPVLIDWLAAKWGRPV